MDVSFWLGVLIGLVVGGGGVWYFKVRSLQKSVITMTGEYRTAGSHPRPDQQGRQAIVPGHGGGVE